MQDSKVRLRLGTSLFHSVRVREYSFLIFHNLCLIIRVVGEHRETVWQILLLSCREIYLQIYEFLCLWIGAWEVRLPWQAFWETGEMKSGLFIQQWLTLYSAWTSQIGLLEMFLINNSLLLNIAKYFCKLLSVLLLSLVHCRSIQHYGIKPKSSRN